MRISAVLAAGVALLTALLLLGETERLPDFAQLQAENALKAAGGYNLVGLESPRLFGTPLKLLAKVIHMPVLGRLLSKSLRADNNVIEVRRLASALDDLPLYNPYMDPKTSAEPPAEPLALDAFTRKGLDAGTATAFRHWSIADYTSRYASGELTPLQVARAVLAGVAANAKSAHPMHLFVEKHDALVLEQARASTERYASGAPLGVLDGVPVGIKDEVAVQGHRTTAGTSFVGVETGVAREDSAVVARLRAAGAIILGKLNMHEIGAGVTGYNMHYGTVVNPHNPAHYPGGSSSASAALVASGLAPLALGIDGGGSVRIPAALCGVVGVKPTFQRVPPIMEDCPSVCQVGPLAGSVRDAAVAYAVISGGDEAFPRSFSQPAVDLRSFEATGSLRGVKIGYFGSFSNHSAPVIARAVETTLQALKARGAELVETPLDQLAAIHIAHSITISSEFASSFDKYYSRFDELSPEVQLVVTYARTFSALDFVAAQKVRAFALRQFQERVFSKVDVFATPTTGITAPEILPDALEAGELNAAQLGDIFRFSVYGNLIGIPGVAVPIGYDAGGLPISIQFQGNHWHEDTVLRLAHATEQLHAAHQRRPQLYFSIIDDAAKQPRD
ncbi:hypothetical protein PybrP1_003554 [[Pythium] brassicae (nom. inval.)]|nr:hypothetical protein PybrP1_003554 [[Pythium] brassicae (nom. inval.)]